MDRLVLGLFGAVGMSFLRGSLGEGRGIDLGGLVPQGLHRPDTNTAHLFLDDTDLDPVGTRWEGKDVLAHLA